MNSTRVAVGRTATTTAHQTSISTPTPKASDRSVRPTHSARALAPSGFFVERRLRKPAQGVNRSSISLYRGRRQKRTWRLVHERHELVRKTRHGTANTDSTDIRTSANPGHPA